MIRHALIAVTTDVPENDLHADDTDIVGVYGVTMGDGPGLHPLSPRNALTDHEVADKADPLEEAAKDVFHDRIGIHRLDHFDISVTVLPEGEEAPADRGGQPIHWL